MRLGGPIPLDGLGPDDWIAALRAKGYRAAYCPLDEKADAATVAAFAHAAAQADIIIAEVGAWSNPISPDEATRQAAITYNQQRLDLADRIGARCCVNVAGARGPRWAGPHPDNLSEATFDLIVETVRQIIDAVRPRRTYYTLEAMPWVYPDTPASYERLLAAVGRERLAVHLDPVNWISSPQRFFGNAALLRESLQRLGPRIKSCHAKDIALGHELTVHLSEVRPGLGGLDYGTFLSELSRLDADTPLMLEHLPSQEEYDQAAAHIRGVARGLGIAL